MNELQNKYIRNQIMIMPMKVTQNLMYRYILNKRSDYDNVIIYIDNFLKGENINRFLVLPGLRDVGKTTILFQVYEYLIKEKNVTPQNILYFACDRLKRTEKLIFLRLSVIIQKHSTIQSLKHYPNQYSF